MSDNKSRSLDPRALDLELKSYRRAVLDNIRSADDPDRDKWRTYGSFRELNKLYSHCAKHGLFETPASGASSSALSTFAPGLLRGAFREDGRYRGDLEVNFDAWIDRILHTCLYVDHLYVPDPLELFAEGRDRLTLAIHNPMLSDRASRAAIDAFERLSPLIESGTVRLYPAMALYRASISESLFGEVRSFTEKELADAWPDLYVAEGLAYARHLGAAYTAVSQDEVRAIENAADEASQALAETDSRVTAALARASIPLFQGISAEDLVRIRSDDQAFADFRDVLRGFARQLAAGVEDPGFPKEVERLGREVLAPEAKKLAEGVTGLSALKKHLSAAGMAFAGGLIGGTLATGGLPQGLLVSATTGLTKILLQLLFERETSRPAGRVFLALHRARPAL